MFAASQGTAWGGGPEEFLVCLFKPSTHSKSPCLPGLHLSTQEERGSHTAARTTSRESPPTLLAARGPFHFLPASPLRTRETNVGRANQLQKRGPERSGTQTRDPRQPAVARAARAGRAPWPAAAAPQTAALRLTRPGPPARRQPPPDLGVPSPRSQAGRRHPAAG